MTTTAPLPPLPTLQGVTPTVTPVRQPVPPWLQGPTRVLPLIFVTILSVFIGFYLAALTLPTQWDFFGREHMSVGGATLSPVSAFVKLEELTKTNNPPTTLTLGPNDYVVHLPPTIGNLKFLTSITIQDQPLTKLPESIGNLTNLKSLIIINTPLTQLPQSIGNLTKLEKLEIAGTNIRKLPASIGDLTNLINLSLSYNKLGELPPTITNLTNLVVMDLTGNNLSKIPAPLPPNLTLIFLGANRIPRAQVKALDKSRIVKGVHY